WDEAPFLLVQGEIPAEVSLYAMRQMHRRQGLVICDPAPASGITEEMLDEADVVTPNEVEWKHLAKLPSDADETAMLDALPLFFERHRSLRLVLLTRGEQGLWYCERGQTPQHYATPSVQAVDPTAAGDSFNGAWAFALQQGLSWNEACIWAVRTAALAVTVAGALPSLPHLQDVERSFGPYPGIA
ncbi:MAG: PfkB family carbohydrate kinase, partial [Firmicutes bacterium]|nr:PfkB family carbohydrate kinase [Bacillota bacterium]